MPAYRLYIDESGDHTYKNLDDPARQYLGLTGVLIHKAAYDPAIPQALEALKRAFFKYDPDIPPILTRKQIIDRRAWFGILRDKEKNAEWERRLLDFYSTLPAQFFTVVIDKKAHLANFPTDTWNPYEYSLAVLLWRIRGFLRLAGRATADVMPESRGNVEDNQLLAAYINLRAFGSTYGNAEQYQAAFPVERLLFRRKDQNITGLQLADLVAAEQKLLTIERAGKPLPRRIGPFGQRLNETIARNVNRYGRYLLE